jgi:hypothetical protein
VDERKREMIATMTTNSLGHHMQVYHVGMQHAYTG